MRRGEWLTGTAADFFGMGVIGFLSCQLAAAFMASMFGVDPEVWTDRFMYWGLGNMAFGIFLYFCDAMRSVLRRNKTDSES